MEIVLRDCLDCKRDNRSKLEAYIDENVNFRTLWKSNPVGGWPCIIGKLIHPYSGKCCCGESRNSVLANILFFLGTQLNKKKRKHNVHRFLALDIPCVLEVDH